MCVWVSMSVHVCVGESYMSRIANNALLGGGIRVRVLD